MVLKLHGVPLSQPFRSVAWACLQKRLPFEVALVVPGMSSKMGSKGPALQRGQSAPLAASQLGSCTSSLCAWRPLAARHSQPVPRVPGPVRSGGADGVRACQECPMASGPDGVHLCRDQARYGRPARPKRLIGRGWPKLGAA